MAAAEVGRFLAWLEAEREITPATFVRLDERYCDELWAEWEAAAADPLDPFRDLGAGEGWALFWTEGSAAGPIQVQCDDDLFDGDETGWLRIWQKACAGDPLARAGLALLAEENPAEVDLIVLWNCAVHPEPVHGAHAPWLTVPREETE